MANPEEMKLEELQRQTALLQYEDAMERSQERKNSKIMRAVKNAQRQSDLALQNQGRISKARGCKHRQGGSVKQGGQAKGKGDSALNISRMPDSTLMVTCSICQLMVFSPNPKNMATQPFVGETKADAKARVAKFIEDKVKFDKLIEKSEDKLTPESAQVMDCGADYQKVDLRTGQKVFLERPCDSYALQMTDAI